MATSVEMSVDDGASDFSEELGMDYPRIEFPQETYDRVCGRLPAEHPPRSKKQKVQNWLSDSESSAASENEVSSRGRKRKSTKLWRHFQAGITKKPAATKKTAKKGARNPLKQRHSAKEAKYGDETDDDSSDDAETEEDSLHSSEVDSSPERRKKRASKAHRVPSAKENKEERGKEGKKKSVQSARDGGVMGTKSDSRLNEKKERKNMDPTREKMVPSHAKFLMKDGKKSSGSCQKVLLNSKHKDHRSASTVPATSHTSAVAPHGTSIPKKIDPMKPTSSDNSGLPSIMQLLFNDSLLPAGIPSFSGAFKVPKKKDTVDDRSVNVRAGGYPLVKRTVERAQPSHGMDPKSAAFAPLPRHNTKPPVKPAIGPMERRQPSGNQTQSILRKVSASRRHDRRVSWNDDVGIRIIEPYDGGEDQPEPPVVPRAPKPTVPQSGPFSGLNWRRMGMESPPPIAPFHMEDYSPISPSGGEGLENPEMNPFAGWITGNSTAKKTRRTRWDVDSPSHSAPEASGCSSAPMTTPLSLLPLVAASPASPDHTPDTTNMATPVPTPIATERKMAPYRFLPIDDDLLPQWNRSERNLPTSDIYAPWEPPVKKCRAILVAGPVPDTVDRDIFEALFNHFDTDVKWMEAAPTKDAVAISFGRSIAAILCYDKAMAEAQLAEGIMVDSLEIPMGSPLEVLVSVNGVVEGFDENELIFEVTDALETQFGGLLVELLLFPSSRNDENVVEGKARFFFGFHATRAACAAPLRLPGGRSISFASCPPEKSTVWITEVHSEEADAVHTPVIIPTTDATVPSTDATVPSTDGSVPSTDGSIPTTDGTVPWPEEPSPSLSSPPKSLESEYKKETPFPVPICPNSKFSPLSPPKVLLPPPGLVDPTKLRLSARVPLLGPPPLLSLPIPASSSIHLPTRVIPPPSYPPVLKHPNLPRIRHEFFPAPPPRRATAGRDELQKGTKSQQGEGLQTVDPATFLRPFQALLPKKEKKEEEEMLLFARPADQRPTDWDAVRAYFKDDGCSSCVCRGMVSLRFTGQDAREKAQLLMVGAPHIVNGQQFDIGLTYSVVLEATDEVGKGRLYDELMDRFGSVVEVERKRDSPAGNPVYKIYFDALEKAQSAAAAVITVDDITFTSQ